MYKGPLSLAQMIYSKL